jgi:hypothetical protein
MAADATALARAVFAGCAASISPLIGIELTPGDTRAKAHEAAPDGELAVLPVALELDGSPLGTLTLHAPLVGIAALGRRMLGDSEPDKERELSKEDLDAIGELLSHWGGAVDAGVREHLDAALRSGPLPWWRTTDPGGNAFASGPHVLARSALGIPGGVEVPISLRLPAGLFEAVAAAAARGPEGSVLLLGLDSGTAEAFGKLIGGARFEVHSAAVDAANRLDAVRAADVVLLGGEPAALLAACRELRLSNETWRTPAIVCLEGPTRQLVLDALHHGASDVLGLPAGDGALLRAIREARTR